MQSAHTFIPARGAARKGAIGAALGLLLGLCSTTALGETVGVGETLYVSGDRSFSYLMMDGGWLRIEGPSGAPVHVSATDAVLARGIIDHPYAQFPGTSFDFYGTTLVPGGPAGAYPADGMYFRASAYDSRGLTVRNFGTFVQSGTGEIRFSGPVTFINEINSHYFIENDRGLLGGISGGMLGGGPFLNKGSLIKSLGIGTSRIELRFDQDNGAVDVASGGIDLLGGGSHTNARFFADGMGTNATGSGIGFNGAHVFNGDILTQTGRFRVFGGSGSITQESGIWEQQAYFEVFGRIDINRGATLRNSGNMQTVRWAGGQIRGIGGSSGEAVFHNAPGGTFFGTLNGDEHFRIRNEGQLYVLDGDGVSAGSIQNSGLFEIDSNGTVSGGNITNTEGLFSIRPGGIVTAGNFVNSGGVLIVDGTLDNWGGTLQLTGGLLAGGGIINGSAFIGGGPGVAEFNPGHSPGTMTIAGDFGLLPGGVLHLEIAPDGAGGFLFDKLVVGGNVMLDGEVNLLVDPAIGEGVDLSGLNFFDCFGCVNYGSNFGWDIPGRPGSLLTFDEHGLHIDHLAPVPEPSATLMLLAGLGLLGYAARRRV